MYTTKLKVRVHVFHLTYINFIKSNILTWLRDFLNTLRDHEELDLYEIEIKTLGADHLIPARGGLCFFVKKSLFSKK